MRSQVEIGDEIKALYKLAKDIDSTYQTDDMCGTCVAAGAHDALRWALGLAEHAVSERQEHADNRD